MKIDISNLCASELDQLIADATEKRSKMKPALPGDRPEGKVPAILNPGWHAEWQPNGTLFQIGHLAFGWIAFVIPHAECRKLASFLQINNNELASDSSTTNSTGGGNLH